MYLNSCPQITMLFGKLWNVQDIDLVEIVYNRTGLSSLTYFQFTLSIL